MKIIYYSRCGRWHDLSHDGIFIRGYTVTVTPGLETMLLPEGRGLFMVVDGMGGQEGGQVATQVILKSLASAHVPEHPDCQDIRHLLYQAAHALWHEAHADRSLANMGAVCAGVWLLGTSALFFNCGDCRVYLARNGRLRQLTRDHSASQALFEKGLAEYGNLRLDPSRSILLTAISAQPARPEIFCGATSMHEAGLFLICSDGLWSELSFKTLETIMGGGIDAAGMVLATMADSFADDCSFIIIDCQATH